MLCWRQLSYFEVDVESFRASGKYKNTCRGEQGCQHLQTSVTIIYLADRKIREAYHQTVEIFKQEHVSERFFV